MGDLRLVMRAKLRTNRRTLAGLVVLGVLGLGITLACLAGARRTDTAFARFLDASHAGELDISFPDDIPLDRRLRLVDQVLALPQIHQAATAAWVFHTSADGSTDDLVTIVPFDDAYLRDLHIPRILDGRLPDPDATDELVLNTTAAERLGLGVGDTIDLVPVPLAQQDRFFTQEHIDGSPRRFTITGVGLSPDDLQAGAGDAFAVLSPAYWREHGGELAMVGPNMSVEVEPGQRAEFEAAVSELLPPSAIANVDVRSGASVSDATHVQAVALAVFGAIVGLTTVLFLALAFARHGQNAAEQADALGALGMTRRRRVVVLAAPLGITAGVIGAGSAIVAAVLSPRFPLGLAGRAEPDRGFRLDPGVVLGGGLVLAVVLGTVALLSTWIAFRPSPEQSSRSSRALPLPLLPTLGLGLAGRPVRGRRTLPLGTVLLSALTGVALVVATVSFGHSLTRLTDDPTRYGWTADLTTGTSDDPDTFDQVAPVLGDDPRIGDWSAVSVRELARGDHDFWVLGYESEEGDIAPVIIDGRRPVAEGEIALGRKTLAELGASVGDSVDLRPVDGDTDVAVEVVGVTVLPGGDHDYPGDLGEGGVMTLAGLAAIDDAPRNVYFASAADGEDPDAVLAAYQAAIPGIYGPAPGVSIDNVDQASSIVPALTIVLALLAVVALAHGLVVAARRRRTDLAVLGALGLRPRQIRSVLLGQAVAVAVVAVVIGVPLGLFLARVTWGPVARGLGVADDVATFGPLGTIGVLGAVVLIAVVVALPPAVLAARTRPAIALRTE